MKLSKYNSEEELFDLYQAGHITLVDFIVRQSPDMEQEFNDYCKDEDILQNEDSARKFLQHRQQLFDEAFSQEHI